MPSKHWKKNSFFCWTVTWYHIPVRVNMQGSDVINKSFSKVNLARLYKLSSFVYRTIVMHHPLHYPKREVSEIIDKL